MDKYQKKLKKALLISPLITPVLYLIGAQFFLPFYDGGFIIAMIIGLIVVTIIILPIAYASTLFFVLPTFKILQRFDLLNLINLVTICSLLGALEFISIVYYLSYFSKEIFEYPQIIYFILFGVVLGGGVSYIFGHILGLNNKIKG